METAAHPHEPAQHIKLQYQPGLPIPLGKTIIWLFLSTEIMFFAGLIGTYVVLRFGAPTWPLTHEVHLSEPIWRVQYVRADLLQRDGGARTGSGSGE